MSEFDAMIITLWLVSLVIAGAAGMTLLLRLVLAAYSLARIAATLMIELNSRRAFGALRRCSVPPGVMMRLAPACLRLSAPTPKAKGRPITGTALPSS